MKNLTDFKSMSSEEVAFVKRAAEKTRQQHKKYDYTDEVIALI